MARHQGKDRRRGHGESSITQMADGRWQARIDLGYVNGKRKRKAIYGKTRQEVAKKLTTALHEHQQGLPIDLPRQTVGQFLTHWLANVVRPSVRPKTYASYEQIVSQHLVPGLGHIELRKLAPQQVQQLLNEKLQSKRKLQNGRESTKTISPRTVAYIHAVLRSALDQALKWGLVARNVAKLVDSPRVERKEVSVLTPETAQALVDAVKAERLGPLCTFALATGLRLGEALGLHWQDVDLDARTIRVRQALQRIDGELRLVEPKTDRSRRTVGLSSIAAAALKDQRRRQLEARLAQGATWQESGLVFTSEVGTPLEPTNISRDLNRMLKRHELPPMRFHDLRHGCASLLFAQGASAREIMEVLGHDQISTTMDIYTHVSPAILKIAADRMDAVFGRQPEAAG